MSFLPRTIGDSIALRDTIAAGTMAAVCSAWAGQHNAARRHGAWSLLQPISTFPGNTFLMDSINDEKWIVPLSNLLLQRLGPWSLYVMYTCADCAGAHQFWCWKNKLLQKYANKNGWIRIKILGKSWVWASIIIREEVPLVWGPAENVPPMHRTHYPRQLPALHQI